MRHFSRRTPSTPVTIGLVAALVLSLCIGMTAALPVAQGRSPIRSLPLANNPASNTVVGCVGTTASGTKVTLGGRAFNPATILRIDASGTCASGETPLSWNRYLSTVLVSPIPGGTAQDNGQALLNAMAFIASVQPGPNKPYLLKVEPGNYDLGTTPLTLLPFVDLEGSGQGVTIISSVIASTNPPTAATLVGADNSQARYIQIVNNNLNGGNETSPAILVPSTVISSGFSIDHVTAQTNHSANTPAGDTIFNAGIMSVRNSDLYSSGAANPRPFVNAVVATATIQSSNLYASNGSSRVRGFYNLGNLTVKDSNITASNTSNKFIYGINSDTTTSVLKVYNTSINVTGTTGGVAVQVPNGQAIIQNSTINSVAVGFGGCANTNSCNIKMAYTQLNASGVGGNSGLTCLGVYDINLQPVTC